MITFILQMRTMSHREVQKMQSHTAEPEFRPQQNDLEPKFLTIDSIAQLTFPRAKFQLTED